MRHIHTWKAEAHRKPKNRFLDGDTSSRSTPIIRLPTQDALVAQTSAHSIWSTDSIQSGRTDVFNGACLDTGAQKLVIGLQQALAYCKMTNTTYAPTGSNVSFRFGVHPSKSRGCMRFGIPTPGGTYIEHVFHVVSADVPMLVGIDLLDFYSIGLFVDNTTNTLVSHNGNWKIPIKRKLGHLYLEWPSLSYPVNPLGFTRVRAVGRDCKASQRTAPRYQSRPDPGRTDPRVAPRYVCLSSGCAAGVPC